MRAQEQPIPSLSAFRSSLSAIPNTSDSAMSKITVAYWDIRGRAQAIRNVLVLAGVPFEDKRYQFGPGSSWAEIESIGQHWYKDKFVLGLDFPNLPYLLDGEVKLSQSVAILKYVARKHELIAKDNVTLARQEMVEQQIADYGQAFIMMVYAGVMSGADYETEKDKYVKTTLPEHLGAIGKYLGEKEWLTGQLSYVDVLAYELLDWQRMFSPNSFQAFPNLTRFLTRFESLPKIKEYFQTSQYKSQKVFSPMCNWKA